MSPPHAVVIAGGRGERLGGVIKADLRIGGRRLLDRVVGALGAVESPLMISIGPRHHWPGLPADAVAVADLAATTGGPLAGLAAAVASLQARGIDRGLLVSVAVSILAKQETTNKPHELIVEPQLDPVQFFTVYGSAGELKSLVHPRVRAF